ncbi:MAG: protein-glutamine glutaminase family protein [Bdellovibrionales bacterium]
MDTSIFHPADIRRLNDVFQQMALHPLFDRSIEQGRCYATAALARTVLAQNGADAGSVLISGIGKIIPVERLHGRPLFRASEGKRLDWDYHVVGATRVKDKSGNDVVVVFDPALCHGPMRLSEYRRAFAPNNLEMTYYGPDELRKIARRKKRNMRYTKLCDKVLSRNLDWLDRSHVVENLMACIAHTHEDDDIVRGAALWAECRPGQPAHKELSHAMAKLIKKMKSAEHPLPRVRWRHVDKALLRVAALRP